MSGAKRGPHSNEKVVHSDRRRPHGDGGSPSCGAARRGEPTRVGDLVDEPLRRQAFVVPVETTSFGDLDDRPLLA